MDLEGIDGFLKQSQDLISSARAEIAKLSSEPSKPPAPPPAETKWEILIRMIATSDVIPNQIKPAATAQAIQETGRGKSHLFIEHSNPFGMKWRDEMKPFAVPALVKVTSEASGEGVFCSFMTLQNAVNGYWAWMRRSPYAGYENHLGSAEQFLRFIGGIWADDPDYTRACLGHLAEARALLRKFGWSDSATAGKLAGDTYLLDAGHSRSAQGAKSRDGRVTEYSMTSMMVGIISERLKAEGAATDLFDPNPDNLVAVGRRAKGKTASLFNHLNAANANGIDEGTEAFVHPKASARCRELAALCCQKVCAAIGTKNRGVKTANFTVLVESHATGAEFNVLMESFFLDDWTDPATITARCVKSAHAIADAVIEYFAD